MEMTVGQRRIPNRRDEGPEPGSWAIDRMRLATCAKVADVGQSRCCLRMSYITSTLGIPVRRGDHSRWGSLIDVDHEAITRFFIDNLGIRALQRRGPGAVLGLPGLEDLAHLLGGGPLDVA